MNKFSVCSCYAAISACPKGMSISAILKLVLVLVEEKKYAELDPQKMVEDFVERFGFKVPYLPMQRIISLGIYEKYFEKKSTLKKAVPIWSAIDNGDFMRLLKEKDKEYESLLKSFGSFLTKKYSKYLFDVELSEHVQAFIQRYGLVPRTDKELLISIKSDYYFADYIHHCIEHGNELALKCIDEYITGCSFAELITFSEPTEQDAVCNANVYLDTGFVFALLGIESKNRVDIYRELLRDMHSLGMHTYIFLHTYSEITGLIENAKVWINNPDYDPLLASETAFYFVTNNWTVDEVIELQYDLKRIIVEDLNINIDDSPYPFHKDIITTDQCTIQEMIVEEYRRNNRLFRAEDKERTIDNDAHSLFSTLHYNENYIAHSLSDVRFIFITTNKSLASVGRKLTKKAIGDNKTSIPIAMSDIEWGTLVWSNSPTKISTINRASIVSAAYAACQPSTEVLNKLNSTLKKYQDDGTLSPDKCYFLKTNRIALSLLSEKTQNDDANYIDLLPFEILKEIQDEGYRKGKAEGQLEVDRITEEKKNQEYRSAIANQEAKIELRKSKLDREHDKLSNQISQQNDLREHIASINAIKDEADKTVKKRERWFNIRIISYAVLYVAAMVCAAISTHAWIISVIGAALPVLGWIIKMIIPNIFDPKQIIENRHNKIEKKVYMKYRVDIQKLSQLNDRYNSITDDILSMKDSVNKLEDEYKTEAAKLDPLSVDIRVIETAAK